MKAIGIVVVAVMVAVGCGGGGGSGGSSTDVRFTAEPALVVPEARAPLGRVMTVDTNVPTRVQVRVGTDVQVNGVEQVFESRDLATHHEIPLFGLRADRAVDLGVSAAAGDGTVASRNGIPVPAVSFPSDFPRINVHHAPAGDQGFTLLGARNKDQTAAYVIILDASGQVVWFIDVDTSGVVTPLANGNFVTILASRTQIQEIDLRGRTVRTWYAARAPAPPPPDGIAVDAFTFHNDVIESAPDDTLLALVDTVGFVDDFPIDENDPSLRARTPVLDQPILEFRKNDGTTVRTWNFLDLLKPTRIGYDATVGLPANADWVHSNAVVVDRRDDSVLASLRHQDAVVKASRVDGGLRWILGPHDNWEGFERFLLTPVGEPFAWPYHQHAPQITSRGTVLIFDNGNWKASPFTGQRKIPGAENRSRAVEYAIDESALTVRQVWEFVASEQLFAPFVGSAFEVAETGNVLITYGGLCTVNGVPSDDIAHCRGTARILEVDRAHGDAVVLDVEVGDRDPAAIGWFVYRGYRIPRPS